MLIAVLWIAGLVVVGWAAARWGWRLGAADVAWGMAPAAGLALGLVAANALAFIVPAGPAAGLSIGLLALAAVVWWWWRRRAATPDQAADEERSAPVDAADTLIWLIAGLAVTVAVGAGAFATLLYDEELQHWPLIATIAEGNFPPRLPFWPDWPAAYHYGFALLAAAVHHLSGLPVWWSIDVLTLVVALAVFWGIAALLRRAGATMNLAVVGAFFVFFGGGWVPGWFAERIPYWLTHAEGPLTGMQAEPMVVGELFKSFAVIVHEHPAALGLVCLIAYCHGWLSVQRQPRQPRDWWLAAGLLALVGGAAALAATSDFVLLLAGTAAVVGLRAGRLLVGRLRRLEAPPASGDGAWWAVRRDSAVLLATLVVGLLSGGAITDLLLRARDLPLGSSLGWRSPPGWPQLTGDGAQLDGGWWWELVLAEYGLPLLLLPVVVWWCWHRPTPLKSWLLATAVIGFVLPLVVQYERDDAAIAAFSRTAGYLWLLLCALTAVELTRGLRWNRLAYGLLGVFVLGSTYMGISFAISLWSPEGLQATAPPLRPAQVQLAARVIELVPPTVRILSDNPRWVTTLAGRLAPSTLAPHFINGDTGDYAAAMRTLDAAAIERLDVAYLHVSSTRYGQWPQPVRAALADPQRFKLLARREAEWECNRLRAREWVALYGIVGRYETAGGGPRRGGGPTDPSLAYWEPRLLFTPICP